MSKELISMNIREVILSIKKDQEYECENFIIKCLDNGTIEIKDRNTSDVFGFLKDDEFIKVEKPVSFDDVLNSDKKCRVEHELIKEIFEDTYGYTGDYYITQSLNHFKNGEYLKLEDILLIIGRFTCNEEVKDIINNGKWFLEE
jgi:hypothetical protein